MLTISLMSIRGPSQRSVVCDWNRSRGLPRHSLTGVAAVAEHVIECQLDPPVGAVKHSLTLVDTVYITVRMDRTSTCGSSVSRVIANRDACIPGSCFPCTEKSHGLET